MKILEELARLVEGARIIGSGDVGITGVEHDSRKISAGDIFVCFEGAHVDGHKFINQAVNSGAVAIMTTREDIEPPEGIAALVVKDMNGALAAIVPNVYDFPAKKMCVIGVTGTNGKTTTTYMIREILTRAGFKVGLIGTIQMLIGDEVFPARNTTPNVIDLQKIFVEMLNRGVSHVVMEVSSHALAENRIAGIDFDAAVFTNLTQDHLDFHKTMANYRDTKAKLFEIARRAAIVNVDDEAGALMLSRAACEKITYSVKNISELRAENVSVRADGMSFTVGGTSLNLHVTGIFNVYNVLAALGAAKAENIPAEIAKTALENFRSVPGRFERIFANAPFAVIVDYAHTPDGVKNVLETARQIAANRIITVFGCGGDRDSTKRPIMGRLAAELSDLVIATSDNPRTENPEKILRDIEAGIRTKIGAKTFETISDRRAAIFRAVELATAGDVVMILGKGHENYQILNTGTIHFDDREVAREAIAHHEHSTAEN